MNKTDILLITPPLTQLNCPYPATTVLSGFLKKSGYSACQYDMGIDLVISMFTEEKIKLIFENSMELRVNKNIRSMQVFARNYYQNIERVIAFLQNPNTDEAEKLIYENILPIGHRSKQALDSNLLSQKLETINKAILLSTMFVEEISDLIKETVNSNFELIRYGEKICLSLPTFDILEKSLENTNNLVDQLIIELLDKKIKSCNPLIIGISIPFPGNLTGGLICAKHIKTINPEIKIVFGGGYVNTELRLMSDLSIFKYIDYLVFDDGELPLQRIIDFEKGNINKTDLLRTWTLTDRTIIKHQENSVENISFSERGCSDYSGIEVNKYISLIEIANPMHSLWSNGFWNKITLAHGCYWAKCAFCDTTLSYIKHFEPNKIEVIIDNIETIIKQTGVNKFHFTDEAVPSQLLRQLSEELIKRNIKIAWWGNIRFEKNFTSELCSLMIKAGCIAVSGGLEMVSPRLLSFINKGVTLESSIKTLNSFAQNNIMVHTYLMYGFPTQTPQETIDALEIVRQLFQNRLIQSAFWHRYAMTIYSDSGSNPAKYGIGKYNKDVSSFANNEIVFEDKYSDFNNFAGKSLAKSLYNYMHNNCLDMPVNRWFEVSVPKTKIKSTFVKDIISVL